MTDLVPVQLGRLYTDALVLARAYARQHGYALAVHGSEMRDLDLIAVPWTDEASTPDVLAEAIRAAVKGAFGTGDPSTRPHGRLTWSIHLSHPSSLGDAMAAFKVPAHPYLDLSVMPLRATPAPPDDTKADRAGSPQGRQG